MVIVRGGSIDGALGVLVGAGCMAYSFRVMLQSLDARARRARSDPGDSSTAPARPALASAWTLTKYVTRWGVIALVLWTALVPLHALPIGVFVGVTVPVLAIALEAVASRPETRSR